MSAFSELRRRATTKRDAAIRLANREYEATLRKIADLEGDMQGDRPAKLVSRAASAEWVRPNGEMTLAEAMHNVLGVHGPLRKVEVCVHVLESGYNTTMTRHALSSYVGKLLRTRPHLFKREAGKWTLVGQGAQSHGQSGQD